MDTTSIVLLSFLAVFHILGAASLGYAVRGFWRAIHDETERVFGYVFLSLFGVLFGCFPLAYGLRATTPVWVLFSQVGLVVLIFVLATFFWEAILRLGRLIFHLNTGLMVLGIIFISAGIYGGITVRNDGGDLGQTLLLGGIFGLIGLGILFLGIINFFRQHSS